MILPAPYDYSPLLSTAQHCNLLIAFMMDAFDIDLSEIIPMVILGAVENAKEPKIPRNTGLPGGHYLRELLKCGNDKRIYSVLRMQKDTFYSLCLCLRKNSDL